MKNDLLYNSELVFTPDVDFIKPAAIWRLTSFLRIKPDFFIGGVQKGGTTSLYYALIQHPHILRSKNKEIFYYGSTAAYEKGPAYYKQFFGTVFYKKLNEIRFGKPMLCMDASTNTIDSKEAPHRIIKDNPKAKIIFILRDPTERAFSNYKMAVRLNWEYADFEKALELEDERIKNRPENNYCYERLGYRSRGIYVNHLKNWYSVMKSENILVIGSEDFFLDPENEFNKITDFLGLERAKNINFEKQNVGKAEKMDPETKIKLNEFYKPYNEELFKFLNRRFDW